MESAKETRHCNEVVLTGRVAAETSERELPSGDVIVTGRVCRPGCRLIQAFEAARRHYRLRGLDRAFNALCGVGRPAIRWRSRGRSVDASFEVPLDQRAESRSK